MLGDRKRQAGRCAREVHAECSDLAGSAAPGGLDDLRAAVRRATASRAEEVDIALRPIWRTSLPRLRGLAGSVESRVSCVWRSRPTGCSATMWRWTTALCTSASRTRSAPCVWRTGSRAGRCRHDLRTPRTAVSDVIFQGRADCRRRSRAVRRMRACRGALVTIDAGRVCLRGWARRGRGAGISSRCGTTSAVSWSGSIWRRRSCCSTASRRVRRVGNSRRRRVASGARLYATLRRRDPASAQVKVACYAVETGRLIWEREVGAWRSDQRRVV